MRDSLRSALAIGVPGEQLTIQVFEDFLRKVWRDKIEFLKLNLPTPGGFRSGRTPSLMMTSASPERLRAAFDPPASP